MSDIPYEERLSQAKSIHAEGLRKVRETPEPKGQKFPVGSFVRISKNLGESMSHFESGLPAQVEHTYAHAYWGSDVDSYCLNVRHKPGMWSTVAWYHEHQLTLITDPEEIDIFKRELMAGGMNEKA